MVRLAKNVRELKPHSFVFSPHFDQQVLGRASCWVPKFISSSALVSYLLTLTSFPPSSTPNLYLRGALNLVLFSRATHDTLARMFMHLKGKNLLAPEVQYYPSVLSSLLSPLSFLSHIPSLSFACSLIFFDFSIRKFFEMIHSHTWQCDASLPGRLELPTLRLTASRSGQLS